MVVASPGQRLRDSERWPGRGFLGILGRVVSRDLPVMHRRVVWPFWILCFSDGLKPPTRWPFWIWICSPLWTLQIRSTLSIQDSWTRPLTRMEQRHIAFLQQDRGFHGGVILRFVTCFWTLAFKVYWMPVTLPETNITDIAPGYRSSRKESSIPTIHFQGRTVSFREGKLDGFVGLTDFDRKFWCKRLRDAWLACVGEECRETTTDFWYFLGKNNSFPPKPFKVISCIKLEITAGLKTLHVWNLRWKGGCGAFGAAQRSLGLGCLVVVLVPGPLKEWSMEYPWFMIRFFCLKDWTCMK